MKRKKFHPHPYLSEVIKDFRTDLVEWREKHKLREIDMGKVLGMHRMFFNYQINDLQEPRISTILKAYEKMREYEASKKRGV